MVSTSTLSEVEEKNDIKPVLEHIKVGTWNLVFSGMYDAFMLVPMGACLKSPPGLFSVSFFDPIKLTVQYLGKLSLQ